MKRKIIVGLSITILAFSFSGCATNSGCTANSGCTTESESNQSVKEMYNDDVYEFIDPDTGVHYWIYSHKAGYGGMGGMTPRLNSDGSIMVD